MYIRLIDCPRVVNLQLRYDSHSRREVIECFKRTRRIESTSQYNGEDVTMTGESS